MKKCILPFMLAAVLMLASCSDSAGAPASPEPVELPEITSAPYTATEPAPPETPLMTASPENDSGPETTDAAEPEDTAETPAAPAPGEAEPSAEPEQPAEASAEPEGATPAEPYSVKTADTVLTVCGDAVSREWYFSLSDLESIGGQVTAEYFSRGKEPAEATWSYTGVDVQHLLENVVGLGGYKKAVFKADDGYSVSFSRSAVNMTYMSEADTSAALKMILAWSENGAPCALRLVMGQSVEGEYNRTNWVRGVCSVEVRAE